VTKPAAHGDRAAPTGRVLFSAADASFNAAIQELRDEFGPGLSVQRLGEDVGVIRASSPSARDVAEACRRVALTFIRHVTVELARVPATDATKLEAVVDAAREVAANAPDELRPGAELALQVWVSGEAGLGYGSRELFDRLSAELRAQGYTVTRSGVPFVMSCCLTPAGVSIGLNTVRDSLSDWPGGRMRLTRGDARVSRAEFKLEELFQTIPLELAEHGNAVDFGAAPGGWTRILRQRGLTVWAVDPGDLDERVAADHGVRHARTTAAEFLRQNDVRFDMAVNDMRMDPTLSCHVMLDAVPSLRAGALAVVTLKIGSRRPVDEVRRCLDLLEQDYRVLFARQLHHNRQEVTVVATLP
jgi:23S rRNA (cytidine2498-2'-O)-methyltransferase